MDYVLVIHGGAGTMSRGRSTPQQREAYLAALRSALQAGHQVLMSGGEAIDAAVAAVSSMEGKGAVFNMAGKNELEASLMLSKPPSATFSMTVKPESPVLHLPPPSRRGFCATLLTRTKNPSQLVRELYLRPSLVPHAFLSGDHVESLGESLGIQTVDPSYYWTAKRWKEHIDGLPSTGTSVSVPPAYDELHPDVNDLSSPLDLFPKGTVGAIALDIRGCIASCTSTGGRTNKQVGRIGDTPMFGCGFWAEEWDVTSAKVPLRRIWDRLCGRNKSGPHKCAVGCSGTGDGDYFIRQNTAASLVHRMKFGKQSLEKASQAVVDDLRQVGGDGGVIALDHKGNVTMKLNCGGMYRGVIRRDGVPLVAIFADDILS